MIYCLQAILPSLKLDSEVFVSVFDWTLMNESFFSILGGHSQLMLNVEDMCSFSCQIASFPLSKTEWKNISSAVQHSLRISGPLHNIPFLGQRLLEGRDSTNKASKVIHEMPGYKGAIHTCPNSNLPSKDSRFPIRGWTTNGVLVLAFNHLLHIDLN